MGSIFTSTDDFTEAPDSHILGSLRRLVWLAIREPWGKHGYWVFAFLGLVAGLIVARAVLVGRLRLFFPFPLCRQGKCYRFGRDYVWRLGTLFGYEGKGIYLYKCRCGDMYIRETKRFRELLRDDTRRRYKKLVAFRKWQTIQTAEIVVAEFLQPKSWAIDLLLGNVAAK
jgi:hypothetical protein